jgi:hypothetical protein
MDSTFLMFDDDIVLRWTMFWTKLCDMAYFREGICSELKIHPEFTIEYNLKETFQFPNFNELTLDYTWNNPEIYKEALVVPELKTLYVPKCLFECLGVYKWFEYSFPNCEILFWESTLN